MIDVTQSRYMTMCKSKFTASNMVHDPQQDVVVRRKQLRARIPSSQLVQLDCNRDECARVVDSFPGDSRRLPCRETDQRIMMDARTGTGVVDLVLHLTAAAVGLRDDGNLQRGEEPRCEGVLAPSDRCLCGFDREAAESFVFGAEAMRILTSPLDCWRGFAPLMSIYLYCTERSTLGQASSSLTDEITLTILRNLQPLPSIQDLVDHYNTFAI